MGQGKTKHDSRVLLKNLIELKEWQKIQDSFASIARIGVRALDDLGKPLTTFSQPPRLCQELLKESPYKENICASCLPTFLNGKGIVDKNLSFTCHAGLCNFIFPLKLNATKILGFIILGPVILVSRKPEDFYRQAAKELNLDPDEFFSAILEIKVVSLHTIQSLIQLIKDICEYTINLAYNNTRQKQFTSRRETLPNLNKILEVILEVAMEASLADLGSLMLVDKNRQFLSIHNATGIPKEIIKNTRVKIGEGISGIAAEGGRAFLINQETPSRRLRPYLKRPSIASAMVLPIKTDNQVVGVMNLGALKSSACRFDSKNLRTMNKLVGLVSWLSRPSK